MAGPDLGGDNHMLPRLADFLEGLAEDSLAFSHSIDFSRIEMIDAIL